MNKKSNWKVLYPKMRNILKMRTVGKKRISLNMASFVIKFFINVRVKNIILLQIEHLYSLYNMDNIEKYPNSEIELLRNDEMTGIVHYDQNGNIIFSNGNILLNQNNILATISFENEIVRFPIKLIGDIKMKTVIISIEMFKTIWECFKQIDLILFDNTIQS